MSTKHQQLSLTITINDTAIFIISILTHALVLWNLGGVQ